MAVLSAPRAGGELKSAPTTENRKRAHRVPVGPGDVGIITFPRELGERDHNIPYTPVSEEDRRASSAGRWRSSLDLDRRACGARDRREKLQQAYPAIAVSAAADERDGWIRLLKFLSPITSA